MSRFSFVLTSTLAAVAFGCVPAAAPSGDNSKVMEKLEEIGKTLASLEEKVGKLDAGPKRPSNRRARPNPNDVYSIPVGDAPYEGAEHAKVTMVEAFEFAWPFCQKVGPTIKQLLKDYEGDLKVAYKHYVVHPQSATTPALASCAANRQGKFKVMEELIWEKGYGAGRNLSLDNMTKLAKEAKLDMTKFKADMDGSCKEVLKKDRAEMSKVGVSGTPAFFINGRFLSGARPIDQFKKLIDEELKKADERIAKGTKVENYYAEFVEKKGKTKL